MPLIAPAAKPMRLPAACRNVASVHNISDGSGRNSIFSNPTPALSYEQTSSAGTSDAPTTNSGTSSDQATERSQRSATKIVYSGIDLNENSLFFTALKTPPEPRAEVMAIFVPAKLIDPSALGAFVNSDRAHIIRKALGMAFECVALTCVGHPKRSKTILGIAGTYESESPTRCSREVYLETVRNDGGLVVGYRWFFVNRDDATWADFMLRAVMENGARKKSNSYGPTWKNLVRSNPHWSIQSLRALVRTLATAATTNIMDVEQMVAMSGDPNIIFTSSDSRANPVNMLSVNSTMKPYFPPSMGHNDGNIICHAQQNISNYVRGHIDELHFPVPMDVVRLPSVYCNLQALQRMLPPNLRPDPMHDILLNLTRNQGQVVAQNDAVFYALMRLHNGQAPRDNTVAEMVNEDDMIEESVISGITALEEVTGEEFFRSTLAIWDLRHKNSSDFAELVRLRESSTLTHEEYVEAVGAYHATKIKTFEDVFDSCDRMTPAEEAAARYLKTHINRAKAADVPIFGRDDFFMQPNDDDTDPTLEFEAQVMATFFRHFEELGATNFHSNLILMTLIAFLACSYDMNVDNFIMVLFGGAGVGKSWSLLLLADYLLIKGTVKKPTHQTNMTNMTSGHTVGTIYICEEMSKARLGIDETNKDNTGQSHHKASNNPIVVVESFHRDEETGSRGTIDTYALKRWTMLGGTNDPRGKIAAPQLDRLISANPTRTNRYAASAQENKEGETPSSQGSKAIIHDKFKLLQSLFYLTRQLVDSKTLFLPSGIARFGAIAVCGRFKQAMRDKSQKVDSSEWVRRFSRVYPIAEALTIIFAICKVQHEMVATKGFELREFALRIIRHLWISEMTMRWSIELCIREFVDPLVYPVMTAIAHIFNYAQNPEPGNHNNGRCTTQPMNTGLNSRRFTQDGTGPNLSETSITAPVNYDVYDNGQINYNVMRWKGTWGDLKRVVVDWVDNHGGKKMTPEQVGDIFKTMYQATIVRRDRDEHRKIREGIQPNTFQVVKHTGTRGYVCIEAAYIDEMLKNPLEQITDVLSEIEYKNQTFRSTVSAIPIDSYPWVLPRIEKRACDTGEYMRCKNVHMPVDPEYLDPERSTRSEFAQTLSAFDRFEFTFNLTSVDDTVAYYHQLSIGSPMASQQDANPFRQMQMTNRKIYVRAQQIGGDPVDALNQARQEVNTNDEFGNPVIDQHFTPSYPLTQILKDVEKQAMNLVDRFNGKVADWVVQDVQNRYQNAIDTCGLPNIESVTVPVTRRNGDTEQVPVRDLPLFTLAKQKYAKSQRNSTMALRLMQSKRLRDGGNSYDQITQAIFSRQRTLSFTPVAQGLNVPLPPPLPPAPGISYMPEETLAPEDDPFTLTL